MIETNASHGEGVQAPSCDEKDHDNGNLRIAIITHKIRTYADLLRQIRTDLRVQHPEWIQANGESPMCDSYEARLLKLLGGAIASGPGETAAFQDQFKLSATRHSILKV